MSGTDLHDVVYAYARIDIQLCMAAKFARAGKLTAKFYTDGWPEFTAVVCHILSPAVSNVSPMQTDPDQCCSY